jgi:glutathione S-transferase
MHSPLVSAGHTTDALFPEGRLRTAAMANLELYELEGCPYCAKVIKKLDELGLDYESHMVPRSHSERTEVEKVSGQTGVPVLVDKDNGVEGMPESDDIVEYLEETYGA